MRALTQRYKATRNVARRITRDAGEDAKPSAVLLAATLEVAAAHLFAELLAGKKVGGEFSRVLGLYVDVLRSLKVLPVKPRGRVTDADEDDPYGMAEVVERQERERRERVMGHD